LGKSDWIIVDCRTNDAFNGWALDGVSRGGHIPGAVDFSADWLKANDKEKLAEILKIKGIIPEKNTIIYDANDIDSKEIAVYLHKNGIQNIYFSNVK